MAKNAYIQPELAGGFRDYLPEDMIPRQKMLEAIRTVFERFGFVPLDTPGLEKEEVLTGGDPDFKKQIFRAGVEGGKDKLALRFDLTVPLARVVAANQGAFKFPLKRYQFGRVWRGERQQAGRFREFTQLDADIVGTTSLAADAEIITMMYETLRALGFADGDFTIRINDRKVLNQLAASAGFDVKLMPEVLRALDKLDKVGWEGVEEEFRAAGLTKTESAVVRDVVSKGDVSAFADLAKLLLIPKRAYRFDLSVARGLGYYTGTVFETVLTKAPEIGSVFSGGRYDGLVSRFGPQNVAAVGASVGVDRLFVAMEKLGMVVKAKNVARVFVMNFAPEAESAVVAIAASLRSAGIAANLYLGDEKTFKGQLAYAVSEEYPVVVIMGADEAARGVAQVKDMGKRTQTEVRADDVAGVVKGMLS